MQNDQLLEYQLRRSGEFDDDTIFKDLLDYALTVRDEMDVYLYMEEQGIGVHHSAYWLARMEVMRK
jgi:predicted NUDIX family phosphoesterase